MDTVAFLQKFVRIPSPSHHETAAAIYLVDAMQAEGVQAFVDGAGNAVGKVGSEGPLLVLLGHIDTVPGDIPVRIQGDTLHGRGTVDAKGPFAAFVCAAVQAWQAGTLGCRVVLVGAVEEEAATSKGAHFILDKYTPDYCIIGEPSGWQRITLGYKGRLLVHYRHEQPAAHSAGEMRAAPENLVDFWSAVQRYCQEYNSSHKRLFDQLVPALRRVSSGGDGLSDWVEAMIGLRLPEALQPRAVSGEILAIMRNIAMQDVDTPGTTTVSFEGACPAFRSARTTPLATAFVRAIASSGGKAGFVHKTGTSDMNVAGPAWGCPIVAYGPGDSRLDHTPDEHLSLAEYQRAIAVLRHVLEHIR